MTNDILEASVIKYTMVLRYGSASNKFIFYSFENAQFKYEDGFQNEGRKS